MIEIYAPSALDDKYYDLLLATGLTTNAFAGTIDMARDIAKLGDFADDAKDFLQRFSKYSGGVGVAIDVIITAHEMFVDGQFTKEDFATFVSNNIVGGIVSTIPVAGGVFATIYDMAGGDDFVEEKMLELINKYW